MRNEARQNDDRILSVDIGGNNIKATILNRNGEMLDEFLKTKTPSPATPALVLKSIQSLIKNFQGYKWVSVGFPGFVKDGIVYTAPNLGTEFWENVPFTQMLKDKLKMPVMLLNDADMQGLGIAKGKGFEIVVTLGTGFGTAFLQDGKLLPHIELAHHPVTKKKTYDEYIGDKALEKKGEKKWNKRLKKIIKNLKVVFNYDHLYIGGGNAQKIDFELGNQISIVENKDGIKGGAKIWEGSKEL